MIVYRIRGPGLCTCASNHACAVARPRDCFQFPITALLPAGRPIVHVHLLVPVANDADCVSGVYLFVFSINFLARPQNMTRLIYSRRMCLESGVHTARACIVVRSCTYMRTTTRDAARHSSQ